MGDVDEDNPTNDSTTAIATASNLDEADLSDEAQDFRFLSAVAR